MVFIEGNAKIATFAERRSPFQRDEKFIGRISCKTLRAAREDLGADGLVHREEYPWIPPKAEYSLTERGKSPVPIPDQMRT